MGRRRENASPESNGPADARCPELNQARIGWSGSRSLTISDKDIDSRIRLAVEYIEAFYDQKVTISAIAQNVGLSVSRLCHLFTEQIGISLIDYLTKVRLDKASHMLMHTDLPCSAISAEVGFASPAYFTRVFKKIYGTAPDKFRSAARKWLLPLGFFFTVFALYHY